MADFVAVIRKAVLNLSDNTPENRERVYEKARSAIRRQLEAMNPPPAEEVMARQMAKLDEAIAEVESEHAVAVEEDQDETDRLMSELEALVDEKQPDPAPEAPPAPPVAAPPPVASPPPARAEPQWTPPPPSQAEPGLVEPSWDDVDAPDGAPDAGDGSHLEPPVPEYRDDLDVAAEPKFPAEHEAPPPPADRPEVITGEEHDDVFGLGDRSQGADETPAAEPRSEPRRPQGTERSGGRSGLTGIVLGLAVLLLLAVAGYAAWSQRDALTAMFSGSEETQTAEPETPAETDTAETETPDAPETASQETETATDQPAEDPDRKFTQRLNADGSESNPGPAPEMAAATAPVEGRSVAAQTDQGNTPPPMEAPGTDGEAGTEEAAGEQTAQGEEPLGVQQKMFLYEERLDQQSPAVNEGSVVWSLIDDPENGGPNNVAIRGEVNTNDGNLSALVTIKRNADKSLPASHIIEIVFALPADFTGGGIDQIQRISMKQTEQDQGNPLIAVPAKITEDFYMIALNDLTEAVQTNTQLLRTRNWIDVPVIYSNGRRALITLEKGATGTEVFNQALDVWAAG